MSINVPPSELLLPKLKSLGPSDQMPRKGQFSVHVWLRDTGEMFTVPKCRPSMKIRELKRTLELITGIPSDFQRLCYIDQGDLMDNSTLGWNDVIPRSTITLTIWPYNSWPELVRAAAAGDVYMLRRVLLNPALPNGPVSFPQRLSSALFISAHRGKKAAVQFLLKCGADVKAQTPQGRTALHVTMHQGHVECVKMLLAHDAPTQLQDCDGLSACDMATRAGQKDVLRLLSFLLWKERTSGLKLLTHLDEDRLFAHQLFDSHLHTWFCGPQAQRYIADFQRVQRGACPHDCHLLSNKRTAQERGRCIPLRRAEV